MFFNTKLIKKEDEVKFEAYIADKYISHSTIDEESLQVNEKVKYTKLPGNPSIKYDFGNTLDMWGNRKLIVELTYEISSSSERETVNYLKNLELSHPILVWFNSSNPHEKSTGGNPHYLNMESIKSNERYSSPNSGIITLTFESYPHPYFLNKPYIYKGEFETDE